MRNLVALTSPEMESLVRIFRASLMKKTATWSVEVRDACNGGVEKVLEEKPHACCFTPDLMDSAYEAADELDPASRLCQGSDLLVRTGEKKLGLTLLGRSSVEAIENTFLPIYGASVMVCATNRFALDIAYECSRAGVTEISLLDASPKKAREYLEIFVSTFNKMKASTFDIEASREGHVSFARAYEDTSFSFGSYEAAEKRIASSDIIICAEPAHRLPQGLLTAFERFGAGKIFVDPLERSFSTPFRDPSVFSEDVLSGEDVFAQWGSGVADVLVDLSQGRY